MKRLKKLLLCIMCSVLMFGFANTVKAEQVLLSGIYCETDVTDNRLYFNASTVPNGNFGGTYRVVSTGNYATNLGTNPTKTYTAVGTTEARITNQGLPAATATRWIRVSSDHIYAGSSVGTTSD